MHEDATTVGSHAARLADRWQSYREVGSKLRTLVVTLLGVPAHVLGLLSQLPAGWLAFIATLVVVGVWIALNVLYHWWDVWWLLICTVTDHSLLVLVTLLDLPLKYLLALALTALALIWAGVIVVVGVLDRYFHVWDQRPKNRIAMASRDLEYVHAAPNTIGQVVELDSRPVWLLGSSKASQAMQRMIEVQDESVHRCRTGFGGVASLLSLSALAVCEAAVDWRASTAPSEVVEVLRSAERIATWTSGHGSVAVFNDTHLEGLPNRVPAGPLSPAHAVYKGSVYDMCALHGTEAAVVSPFRTFRVLDVTSRRVTSALGMCMSLAAVAPGLVAAGSSNKTIQLWDTARERMVRTMTGHDGSVYSLCRRNDGAQLVSGAADNTLRIWSVERGVSILTLPNVHSIPKASVDQVAVLPQTQDNVLATSCDDDTVCKVWDVRTRSSVLSLDTGDYDTGAVLCAGALGSSPFLAFGKQRLIDVYDLTNPSKPARTLFGHTDDVISIAAIPATPLLVSSGRDCSVRFWDVRTAQNVYTIPTPGAVMSKMAPLTGGDEAYAAQRLLTLTDKTGVLQCWTFVPSF